MSAGLHARPAVTVRLRRGGPIERRPAGTVSVTAARHSSSRQSRSVREARQDRSSTADTAGDRGVLSRAERCQPGLG